MPRALVIAALAVAALAAPAAQADPLIPRTCHYWTDYGFCTPAVENPLDHVRPVDQICFHLTDYPTCIPPG